MVPAVAEEQAKSAITRTQDARDRRMTCVAEMDDLNRSTSGRGDPSPSHVEQESKKIRYICDRTPIPRGR